MTNHLTQLCWRSSVVSVRRGRSTRLSRTRYGRWRRNAGIRNLIGVHKCCRFCVACKFQSLWNRAQLRFTGCRISAWKRSIDRPIAMDKRISLITAIFSNRGLAEAVKRLSRDDAQAFVDVVDEVLLRSSVQGKWLTGLLNSKSSSCRLDIG